MKVFWLTVLTIIFFGISAIAFHHGPCASGNSALVLHEEGGESFTACCVGVGGGQLSCTAGGCWFNYPVGGGNVIVPDCAVQ